MKKKRRTEYKEERRREYKEENKKKNKKQFKKILTSERELKRIKRIKIKK